VFECEGAGVSGIEEKNEEGGWQHYLWLVTLITLLALITRLALLKLLTLIK